MQHITVHLSILRRRDSWPAALVVRCFSFLMFIIAIRKLSMDGIANIMCQCNLLPKTTIILDEPVQHIFLSLYSVKKYTMAAKQES